MLKKWPIVDIITHLFFLIWGIFAVYFWQERLYGDAGFYIAKVVDYEAFRLDLGRYILVFSQWLPLLFIKLHLSLKTVLIGYSLGHVIYFYVLYLLGRFYFQQRYVGLLLLALQLLGMGYAFTTQGFELYYSMGLLVILYCLWEQPRATYSYWITNVLLTTFLVINYQLIIYLLGALLLLQFYQYKWKKKQLYLTVGLAVLFGVFVKQYFLVFTYEQEKTHAFLQQLFHYNWSIDYFKQLLLFVGEFYWDVVAIFSLTAFFFIQRQRWALLVGYGMVVLGGLFIATLSFPSIAHTRYQEQCYFFFIAASCLPLFLYILPQSGPRLKKVTCTTLAVLFLFRWGIVYQSMEIFTKRVQLMHRLIAHCQKLEGHKFIMEDEHTIATVVHPFFSFSMESMLLSAAHHYPKTINLALASHYHHGQNDQLLADSTQYISTHRGFYNQTDSLYSHRQVNTKYFNFAVSPYRWLNTKSALAFRSAVNHLELEAQLPLAVQKETTFGLPISLHNKRNKLFPSKGVSIGYSWWQAGQKVDLEWRGYQNPIEVDLLPNEHYQQLIRIHTPLKTGEYHLRLHIQSDSSTKEISTKSRIRIE